MLRELAIFALGYTLGGGRDRRRPFPIVSLTIAGVAFLAIVVGTVIAAMIVLWILIGTFKFLRMLGRAIALAIFRKR